MKNGTCAQPRENPPSEEAFDRELEDSFPASDPPQSTMPSGHPGGPYRAGDFDEAKAEAEAETTHLHRQ